jgi:methyltransferase OMS1
MSSSTFARKAGVLIAGGGIYASAVYTVYHYSQMNNLVAASDDIHTPNNNSNNNFSFVMNPARNQQYQNIADFYDDRIGRDEFFMGINLLRRSLLYFHCKGTVLEVGAGTARNLKYYTSLSEVERVVLMDQSNQMLDQARNKVADLKLDQQKRFACVEADAANLNPLIPDDTFDTVVDTFGLCSYDNPVAVLKEMARVCKPTGKILLLEHGRSKNYGFITKHLDQHAETHAKNWGCVWNRDLDDVLEKSGLQVERLQKWHFGTTYYVVCRPASTP